MIDEKNLQNENLEDEELEKVSGGNGETPEVQNNVENENSEFYNNNPNDIYNHGGH